MIVRLLNLFSFGIASMWVGLSLSTVVGATVTLDIQRRDEAGQPYTEQVSIDPQRTVIVESDIWNNHWDVVMKSRVGSIVPRVNDGYEAARALGIAVLHAQADVINPPASNPMRRKVKSIADVPLPPWSTTNFMSPRPFIPYNSPDYPSMSPPGVSPPGQTGGVVWTAAHPDMEIDLYRDVWLDATHFTVAWDGAGSWNSSSRDLQELHNYTTAHDIDTVIYYGGATNMSALGKGFGMVQAKRLGLKVLVATDMSFTFTGNGYNYPQNQAQPSLTPDSGEREVNAWIERQFDGTFNFAQLLETQPQFAYTSRVTQEPSLLSYWRLDGTNGNRNVQDVMRVQEAWNMKAGGAAGVELGAPGAIAGDSDTAARFDGTNALLVSPMFRNDTPAASPLSSLSASSFSVEAWVQVEGGLGSQQWILSHDGGSRSTVDFLLGVDPSGAFRFTTRSMQSVVRSDSLVTLEDVDAKRWRHVVGVQDTLAGELRLYVDGQLEQASPLVGTPVTVGSSLQIGSRGTTTVSSSGAVTNAGYEFFRGLIDEVAVYSTALDAATIATHFELGTGVPQPIEGLSLAIDRQTGMATLTNHSTTDMELSSYSIVSGMGSLRPSDWQSLAEAIGQPGLITSESSRALSESADSGMLLSIPAGAEVSLGELFTTAPWQDVQFKYTVAGSAASAGTVVYFGSEVAVGDFDGSGAIDEADWGALVANYRSSLLGASRPEAHRRGDIDGDGAIAMTDVILFRDLYRSIHGSSASLTFQVPEPSGAGIVLVAGCAFSTLRARRAG